MLLKSCERPSGSVSSEVKSSRITRAYLDPLQFSQYEQLFQQAAHEDGQVNLAELQDTSSRPF